MNYLKLGSTKQRILTASKANIVGHRRIRSSDQRPQRKALMTLSRRTVGHWHSLVGNRAARRSFGRGVFNKEEVNIHDHQRDRQRRRSFRHRVRSRGLQLLLLPLLDLLLLLLFGGIDDR
jgi:hypothetical protein